MKKLLVVALSAMLVFAVSAVSMAAVTLTGEANVGLTLAPDAIKGNFSDCKIVADAAVNDTVSVNAALKASNTAAGLGWDTYSISSKFDMGTLKLGYFGHALGGKKDILTVVIPELKPAGLIQFAANISEGMTATVSYAYGNTVSDYVASFKYDVAPLFVEVGISNQSEVSGTALNVGYTIGEAITPYLCYQTIPDTEAKTTLVGVVYTSGAISARLEYDTQKYTIGPDEVNGMGLKVAYTAGNGLIYTLSNVTDAADGAAEATTQVKVTAKF